MSIQNGLQKLITTGSLDVTSLKIQEKVVNPTPDFFNSSTPVIEKGMIIVRPVRVFNSGRQQLLNVSLKKSGKALVLKAYMSDKFFTKHWIARTSDKKGIVCFCNKEVPDEWTHFEVINVGKENKSVEVKPHVISETALITNYYEMPPPVKHGGIIK